jgi:hypothetical protein
MRLQRAGAAFVFLRQANANGGQSQPPLSRAKKWRPERRQAWAACFRHPGTQLSRQYAPRRTISPLYSAYQIRAQIGPFFNRLAASCSSTAYALSSYHSSPRPRPPESPARHERGPGSPPPGPHFFYHAVGDRGGSASTIWEEDFRARWVAHHGPLIGDRLTSEYAADVATAPMPARASLGSTPPLHQEKKNMCPQRSFSLEVFHPQCRVQL